MIVGYDYYLGCVAHLSRLLVFSHHLRSCCIALRYGFDSRYPLHAQTDPTGSVLLCTERTTDGNAMSRLIAFRGLVSTW